MTAYTPLYVKGNKTGLVQSREDFILPDDAYPQLENAYVWRERILRKNAYQLLDRLRRCYTVAPYFFLPGSPWTLNLLVQTGYVTAANNANPGKITTKSPHNLVNGNNVYITGIVGAVGYNNTVFAITVVDSLNFTVGVNAAAFGAYVSGGFYFSNQPLTTTEPNAQLEPGSVIITLGGITFTDDGMGNLVSVTPGNSGTINYQTGVVVLTTTAVPGTVANVTFCYFPTLPVMGIRQRDLSPITNEMTVFFDTTYAYNFTASAFVEFIPGTTWSRALPQADPNFFWSTNYWVDASVPPKNLFW